MFFCSHIRVYLSNQRLINVSLCILYLDTVVSPSVNIHVSTLPAPSIALENTQLTQNRLVRISCE